MCCILEICFVFWHLVTICWHFSARTSNTNPFLSQEFRLDFIDEVRRTFNQFSAPIDEKVVVAVDVTIAVDLRGEEKQPQEALMIHPRFDVSPFHFLCDVTFAALKVVISLTHSLALVLTLRQTPTDHSLRPREATMS